LTINGLRSATDECVYDENQIRRVAQAAFNSARLRTGKVCSVDKANVLATSKLWREIIIDVANSYPEIKLTHMLVDNCAMQMVLNPQQFDVIVTENMFGDIISDLAAALPGSLGLVPSASLNDQGLGLYEPSGGSAPDIAGHGIANPCAQILSAALMLRYSFGMDEEAKMIENAVNATISKGIITSDLASNSTMSVSTTTFTDHIVSNISLTIEDAKKGALI
jgi:3-isopropylmalate dehydrogenase